MSDDGKETEAVRWWRRCKGSMCGWRRTSRLVGESGPELWVAPTDTKINEARSGLTGGET